MSSFKGLYDISPVKLDFLDTLGDGVVLAPQNSTYQSSTLYRGASMINNSNYYCLRNVTK